VFESFIKIHKGVGVFYLSISFNFEGSGLFYL
jgi:hypothetical protein